MHCLCCICAEALLDANVETVSTKCGHVFHQKCITTWLHCNETCPKCRRKTKYDSLIKLFFNDDLNYSTVSGNELVDSMGKEINSLKRKVADLKGFLVESEEKCKAEEQKRYKAEKDLSTIKLQLKPYEDLKIKCKKLINENDSLTKELEFQSDLKQIVTGSSEDVKGILSTYGMTDAISTDNDNIYKLATFCSVLKRELQNCCDRQAKLKSENVTLTAKLGFAKAAARKAEMALDDFIKKTKSPLPSTSGYKATNSCSDTPRYPFKSILQGQNSENLSPITSGCSPDMKKNKLRVDIVGKEIGTVSDSSADLPSLPCLKFIPSRPTGDDDSVVKFGYDGLGGHSKFISLSSKRALVKSGPLKKKRLV